MILNNSGIGRMTNLWPLLGSTHAQLGLCIQILSLFHNNLAGVVYKFGKCMYNNKSPVYHHLSSIMFSELVVSTTLSCFHTTLPNISCKQKCTHAVYLSARQVDHIHKQPPNIIITKKRAMSFHWLKCHLSKPIMSMIVRWMRRSQWGAIVKLHGFVLYFFWKTSLFNQFYQIFIPQGSKIFQNNLTVFVSCMI